MVTTWPPSETQSPSMLEKSPFLMASTSIAGVFASDEALWLWELELEDESDALELDCLDLSEEDVWPVWLLDEATARDDVCWACEWWECQAKIAPPPRSVIQETARTDAATLWVTIDWLKVCQKLFLDANNKLSTSSRLAKRLPFCIASSTSVIFGWRP